MTSKATGDYKAIIVVAKDKDAIIYVRHAWIKHSSPVGMVQSAYNRFEDFPVTIFGFEENSLKEFLWETFDTYSRTKGYHLPLRPINNTMAKEDRIMRLSPLIERGKIRFLKGDSDQDKLIEQLIFYGQPGIHDDGPDALEMAVRIVNQVVDLVTVIDAAEEDPHWR